MKREGWELFEILKSDNIYQHFALSLARL